MSQKTLQRIIFIYSWIFLLAGILFVSAPALITEIISEFFIWMPWSIPWMQEEPTLWLALTGSMMAMLSFCSYRLSKNLADATAWNTIVISKTISTLLFLLFALTQGNSLWITTAIIDGAIGLHFIWMRLHHQSVTERNPWAMRYHFQQNSFYEVWFLKMNDPLTKNALWARYTILKKHRRTTATCWYILFDSVTRTIRQGRWDGALADPGNNIIKIGESFLGESLAQARHDHVSWDIQWQKITPSSFEFIPKFLNLLGVAKSSYVTPLSAGTFNAQASIDGQTFSFRNAPGGIGHIWGSRMAQQWRWAHCIFEHQNQPVVIEILSAQALLGKFLLPPLTFAHLWFNNTHYQTSLFKAIAVNKAAPNGSALDWSFDIDFGTLRVQGQCRPGNLVADVIYEDTLERELICHNTKTGSMTLDIFSNKGASVEKFQTDAHAAIETVEPFP